jgi:hypothetical protein
MPDQPPSGAAPPTGEPSPNSEPQARTLKGAGLRYGAEDGVPAWAQGKTADEILNIATQAVGVVNSYASAPAAPAPYTQNVPSEPMAPTPPDPELAYSNPAEWARAQQRWSDYQMQAQFAAASAPVLAQLAETARELSRSGQYRDAWQRWEPEIELKLAGIPMSQRNKALYDQAAALVRADHFEEIARERATQLVAQGAGTERGSPIGGEPRPADDPLVEAFESGHPFFERAKTNGMTPAAIRKFCEQTGTSVTEYIENATRGTVLTTPNGFVRAHA